MKKNILVVVAQLAMAQDIIFKKYEDAKGVQTVYLSKTLLSLAAGSLDDVEDMDLRSIAGKLDNLRILDCEKAGMAAKIKVDALAEVGLSDEAAWIFHGRVV